MQAVLPLEGRLETALGSGVFLAYYDPNLDITWAADANINGVDNWDNQVAWAAGLALGGVSGWRLPLLPIVGPFKAALRNLPLRSSSNHYWEGSGLPVAGFALSPA
jgi:hypothetical protein